MWQQTLGKYVTDEYEQRGDSADRNYPCIVKVTTTRNTALRVAGFDVKSTTLYFACTPNSQRIIDHKIENTSFYMGKYQISPVDTDNAISVLTEKINGIYGFAQTTKNSDDCATGAETYYVWTGANSTKIVLVKEDISFSDEPDIYLYYCNEIGTDLIKEAEQLQKQAEASELQAAGADGL